MKIEEREVFEPFVPIDNVVGYCSQRRETWTASELVNAFCRAMEKLGPSASGKDVAEFMGLNYVKLNGAIEIACGATIPVLKIAILEHKLCELRAKNPHWTTDMLAKSVGLYDRSSMRRILGKEAYSRLVRESAKSRRAKLEALL